MDLFWLETEITSNITQLLTIGDAKSTQMTDLESQVALAGLPSVWWCYFYLVHWRS